MSNNPSHDHASGAEGARRSFLNEAQRTRILGLTREVAAGGFVAESDTDVLNVFARATWSGIGEPGDRMVSLVCDYLGAWSALEMLLSGMPSSEMASILRQLPAESIDSSEQLDDLLSEAYARWNARLSLDEGIAHLERAKRIGARLITPEHDSWPAGLQRLGAHAPVALWARGHLAALDSLENSVSIVGARASTGYGEHVTMDMVGSLVDRGFTIVSGAAYGIDGMAHRAALASEGSTIAVLAGGIDRLYPSGHDALLRRIIEQGLVLTELPCGFAPTKWRFLQRNRIIAALTEATIVIEAGWRSGSLNTAHHAFDMNIPVGAVPGPVTSAASAGCHRLLREDPAVCVTRADDVIELVRGFSEDVTPLEDVHPHAVRVFDALLTRHPRDTYRVARESGLTEAQALATLGLLELRGTVSRKGEGWVRA